MANNSFSLYGAKLDSNVIGGIQNMTPSPGIQPVVQGGSGAAFPSYAGVLMHDARVNFTTVQLAQMLALCGITGYSPSSSADFAFQMNTEFGTRASTYRKLGAYKCLVVPRTLDLTQGKEATLAVEVFAAGDDSNAPFAVGTGSLAWTQAVTEKFTLGPMQLNGTDVQLQSLRLDFGLDIKSVSRDGLAWNVAYYIGEAKPKFTMTTFDLALMGTIQNGPAGGLAVTSLLAFAQKIAEGGDNRVAAATAEHISFECTDGLAYIVDVGGGHNSEIPMQICVEPVHDGTNAIIQLDTTAAIAFE